MKTTDMVPDKEDYTLTVDDLPKHDCSIGHKVNFKEWEKRLANHYQAHTRAAFLKNASDAQLRLIGGEMTDQEIRTVRAFLNYILP